MFISERLNWDENVQQLSTKLSKNIGVLLRLKLRLTIKLLYLVYNSLILPYLNYCNLIWFCASPKAINKIVTLQKKAIRIINNAGYREHSIPLFKKLGLLKVEALNRQQILIIMDRFSCNSSLIISLITFMKYLQYNLILLEIQKVIAFLLLTPISNKKCIRHSGPRMWNQLPCEIKQAASLPNFNSKFKKILLNEYLYIFLFISTC